MAPMMTHFQDFTKDNGLPVTVEYEVEGSYSPTTYSPLSGADGGDAPTFCILSSWPNTESYDGLLLARTSARRRQRGKAFPLWLKQSIHLWLLWILIKWYDRRARLTDAERERMEDWLVENYVEEPPDFEDDYR